MHTNTMLPAPRGGGFRMEGYWIWCGSVVQGEDGKFHMFASRWPKTLPMHPGWMTASEIVRADSDTPEGPYRFREVALPARGAEYWDGRCTHNPQKIAPERANSVINAYMLDFFDMYLKNQGGILMKGPDSRFSEVKFVTSLL